VQGLKLVAEMTETRVGSDGKGGVISGADAFKLCVLSRASFYDMSGTSVTLLYPAGMILWDFLRI
jgi:hypothetical protein